MKIWKKNDPNETYYRRLDNLQHVKFAHVGVDQFGLIVDTMHHFHTVQVEFTSERVVDSGVFEQRRREAIFANELHHQHMTSQKHRLRAFDVCLVNASQIAELFFGPHFDHFARVVTRIAFSKPVI